MMPSYRNQSYVLESANRLKQIVSISIPSAEKDLLVCLLTIKAYQDLLIDPNVNLAEGLSREFINEVMIPDFNLVIIKLRDYAGHNRRGVTEAYALMQEALRKLYSADSAFTSEDPIHYAKSQISALLDCRLNLQRAYQQLEHLDSILEGRSPTMGIPGESSVDSPRPEDKWEEKTAESSSESEIKPPTNKPPEKLDGDSSDEVSFTAFYPKEGKIDTWHTLLVYTHILSALERVRRDAKRFDDEIKMPKESTSTSSTRLARGTVITIVPFCEGIAFNPEHVSLKWIEDFHRADFRFKADKSLSGDAGRGCVSVYVGPLIIGTIKFAMLFNDSNSLSVVDHEVQSKMYHKDAIFISYSHKDSEIALAFKKVHEATGYDVLIDIDKLRSGQEWNSGLMRMIDRADIFQLFWSTNSKKSKYCKQEWKHALKRGIEGFIRPIYWKEPIPNPPKELGKYHFEYVDLHEHSI